MKVRSVFKTPDLAAARRAMDAARHAGIDDSNLSLVARADIELEQLPDHRLNDHHDVQPAAIRGLALGGGSGLLLGLVAVAVPLLGLTLAGAAVMAAAGAAVGAGSGALIGLDVPDAVSRTFKEEIRDGHILVVLDGEPEILARAEPAVESTGAVALPFNALTSMS